MPCPRCTGPSENGRSQSCQQDDDHEYWENRVDEMSDITGIVITGPDAADRHVIGDGGDE